MKIRFLGLCLVCAALPLMCGRATGAVSIVSLTPSLAPPQPIGAIVEWTAQATDTNSGPLTFQFNVAPPGGALTTVKNFNVGTLGGGTWSPQAFGWGLTGRDGTIKCRWSPRISNQVNRTPSRCHLR